MSAEERKRRLFRLGFAVVGVLVALTALLGPVALFSLVSSPSRSHVDDAFAITPSEPADPNFTQLHAVVTAVDESQRLATLRVSGFHFCTSDCVTKLKVVLFSLDVDGRGANSIPPSASVSVPGNAAEIREQVQLPIRGNLLNYPFDSYTLRLGLVLEKVNADGSASILPAAEARGQLVMTVQEQAQRLVFDSPKSIDPASVQPTRAPFQYAYVTGLQLDRPAYLKILVVLMVLLITAASVYAVVLRPFDQLIQNASALIFGVWGVRSLILGNFAPDATYVDVVLLAVIFALLGAVTFRAWNYMHRNAGLRFLVWALPPAPKQAAAASAAGESAQGGGSGPSAAKPESGSVSPSSQPASATSEVTMRLGVAAPATGQLTCTWCGRVNPPTLRFCPSCGHRADLPRTACDCGAAGCKPRPR